MEIKNMNAFLSYYERTREITKRVIEVIPRDQLDYAYLPGKFTVADLVRHIAAIERNVFAEVAVGNKSTYRGCGKELADGYENIMSYFHLMHKESVEIFKSIKDDELKNKIKSLDGKEIELGSFLRALVVHEIHHRAALCIYLNLLNVESPPIIGLKEEQVILLSK
jgi:uncharacterized damage-inducible protein DinB